LKAIDAQIKNTYTFDLGIPGWAEQYPEQTVLLGTPLPESRVKFIPQKEFKEKLLSWKEFQEKAMGSGVVVVDTRDSLQKGFLTQSTEKGLTDDEMKQLTLFREKNKEMLSKLGKKKIRTASFDMLERFILTKKRYRSQTLLIFDQVGKQVRWLMYTLEQKGIKKYFFLDKGANGVIGFQAYGDK